MARADNLLVVVFVRGSAVQQQIAQEWINGKRAVPSEWILSAL